MTYLSIQILMAVFQGTISLLPAFLMAWEGMQINEKLQAMGVNKHHGISFTESICHMSYLPFINGKSLNQLSDNIPYHSSVFSDLWDKVNPIKWWQLIEAVADEMLFSQVRFPDMAKTGILALDDTPMEKFGIHMENISEIRLSGNRIRMGYVAFLACLFLPEITICTACKVWVPACVPGYESKVSMAIATVKHLARQAEKANLSIAGMAVVFDNWYFAVELCKTINRYGMIWITQSKSNRIFFIPDDKGHPTIKKRASDFLEFPVGKMKWLPRKQVKYHNVGRCYLPKYGWVYATVVYDPTRNPDVFLLVSNRLDANGPWMIETYCERWQIESVIRDAKQSLGLPDFHTRHFSGISAHLCICMLNHMILSWVRYSQKLKLTIGEMVNIMFHELVLKAVKTVEEAHYYSFSQQIALMSWLPIAA